MREVDTKNRINGPPATVQSLLTERISTQKVVYGFVHLLFIEFRWVQEKQHQNKILHFSSNSSFYCCQLSYLQNNARTAFAGIIVVFIETNGIILPRIHIFIVKII